MKKICTKALNSSLVLFVVSFSLIATSVSGLDLDTPRRYVVTLSEQSGALVSKSQANASEANNLESLEIEFGVSLIEEYRAENQRYVILSAINRASLDGYLTSLDITAMNIVETEFTNSPVLGGGAKAGPVPKAGHKIYVIERAVPGISGLPLRKQREISQGSQHVVAGFGDSLEWDRSFLTKEGTFCVYRTDDVNNIREHASIAGFPADKVSLVEQTIYNYDFR